MTYASITTTLGFGDVRLTAPPTVRIEPHTSTPRILPLYGSGTVRAGGLAGPGKQPEPATQGILPFLEPCQQPLAPALRPRLQAPMVSRSIVAPPRFDPLLLAAAPSGAWLDPAVQSRLSPSVSVYVYVCGTYALQGLREILNATIYKAGTTAR